jgi:O-acetylserine/cysteine efflux transporter
MLVLSLVFEGPARIGDALAGSLQPAALPAWLGLAYTCIIGTAVGSGIWTWLMARHPAGVVAPFSLLVPVAGMLAAGIVLGERPTWLELLGGSIVVAGVLVGARAPRPNPAPVDLPDADPWTTVVRPG